MKIEFKLPFKIVRNDEARSIYKAKESLNNIIVSTKKEFEQKTTSIIHQLQKEAFCATCGKNVYRQDNWVHGNGGNAYCARPCWQKLEEEWSK